MIIQYSNNWVENLDFEVVERKGIGHPDTIMDNIVEECSKKLSEYYLNKFGYILHHNLDKGVLIGGKSLPKYKGGKIIEPIKIIVVGRATTQVDKEIIPIGEIILKASKNWIKNNIRFLKENYFIIDYGIKQGSVDLMGIYNEGKDIALANDTSVGVGFYPFSRLEKYVYEVEKYLRESRKKYEFIGEDIKVMGIRDGENIRLILAVALIDKFIENIEDYKDKIEKIKDLVEKKFNIPVNINVGDNLEKEIIYLTVTGTSAESGDDGQVGRGNRANGLITPMRKMSLEATAGKNPHSHVGKIYNVWSNIVAKEIYDRLGYKNEIVIVSKIGHPINEPAILGVNIYEKNCNKEEIKKIIKEYLNSDVFKEVEIGIVKGKYELF